MSFAITPPNVFSKTGIIDTLSVKDLTVENSMTTVSSFGSITETTGNAAFINVGAGIANAKTLSNANFTNANPWTFSATTLNISQISDTLGYTIQETGVYSLNWGVGCTYINSNEVLFTLFVNGLETDYKSRSRNEDNSDFEIAISASAIISLNSTDTVDLRFSATSALNNTDLLFPFFNINRIN